MVGTVLVVSTRHGRRALRIVAIVGSVAAFASVAGCTAAVSGTGRPAAQPSSPPTASASPSGGSSPIAFTDCSRLLNVAGSGIPANRLSSLRFDCGKLNVPLDYDQPDGQTIAVQVLRVHSRNQATRTGSLLVDPGGPGASGIVLALNLSGGLSEEMLARFDLIGFDPRGVGLSTPVRCTTDAEQDRLLALDPDVRTPAGFAQAKHATATVAQECTAKYHSSLQHFNTVETARDMDRIRAALGEQKMNYLGFSYGTELGAAYAHLFPDRIRAMVLDGAVDPTTTGDAVKSNDQQIGGFEQAFDQFASACAGRPACAALGPPRAAVQAIRAKANAAAIPSSRSGETRKATGGTVLYAVLSALYSQDQWGALGDALLAARGGDAKGLFELVDSYSNRNTDGSFDNLLDVFLVVSCNDQGNDPTDAVIAATAKRWASQYPLFGLWSATSLFNCQSWQRNRHPVPQPSAAGSPPILVVGNLHDPATPYSGAVNLSRVLKTGVLLTLNGQGHTSYGQSQCIRQTVDRYLLDQTVPAANTTCSR